MHATVVRFRLCSSSFISYPHMSLRSSILILHLSLDITYTTTPAAGFDAPYHLYILRTNFDNFYHTIPPRICISQPCIPHLHTPHCFFAFLKLLICHICTDYYFSSHL